MTFNEKEELGRNLTIGKLSNYLDFEYEFTKDTYDAVDIIITIGNKKLLCEVKYRAEYKYTDYDTVILEKTKISHIFSKYGDANVVLLYLVYWKDDVLEIFDLRRIRKLIELGEIKEVEKVMRKNNYQQIRVSKKVYLLKHKYNIKKYE